MNSLTVEPADMTDPGEIPTRLLYNDDVHLYVSRRREPMSYYMRNADGDEIYFVHEGTETVESDYGPVPYERGDYVVIPQGPNYRTLPETPHNFFPTVESRKGPVGFPDRRVLGQRVPFNFALLELPPPQPILDEGGEYAVRIKRADERASVYHTLFPLNTAGIRVPCLVMTGTADRDIYSSDSEAIHAPIPHSDKTLAWFVGAEHYLLDTRAEAANTSRSGCWSGSRSERRQNNSIATTVLLGDMYSVRHVSLEKE